MVPPLPLLLLELVADWPLPKPVAFTLPGCAWTGLGILNWKAVMLVGVAPPQLPPKVEI